MDDQEKRTTRAAQFVDKAFGLQESDASTPRSISYVARILAQVTLPHSMPSSNEFQRINGNISLHMMAPAGVGLPYGTYPRVILTWIATEAVRTRSMIIELGNSLSAFMRELDLEPTGGRWGTVLRLREHMNRLIRTAITLKIEGPRQQHVLGILPIYGSHLFWDPKRPHQQDLWQSTIELNPKFYEAVIDRPVPVDMRAIRILAHERSPLALDIYTWLTYRMSYLEEPVIIPWTVLQCQFGGDFKLTRQFKAKFLERLRLVKELYPAARVKPSEDRKRPGLILEPSPTHVPKLISPKLKALPAPPLI